MNKEKQIMTILRSESLSDEDKIHYLEQLGIPDIYATSIVSSWNVAENDESLVYMILDSNDFSNEQQDELFDAELLNEQLIHKYNEKNIIADMSDLNDVPDKFKKQIDNMVKYIIGG